MTIEDVDTFQFFHWSTVKEKDKKAQVERDLKKITVLRVDEIAVGEGHNNYWYIVSTLEGAKGSENYM